MFVSRMDNQIKHMGHRIELGEIEIVANSMEEIKSACAVFDQDRKKIVLCYVGEVTTAQVALFLKEKLPRYMIPNVTIALQDIALNL